MIYGIAVFSVLQCSYCPKRSAMISGKLYSIRGLLSSIFCPKRRASRMANARPRRGTRKPDLRIRGAAVSLIPSSQNCYNFATKARASFMKISFFFSFSQIYPQFPQSFPQFLGKKRLFDVILTNLRKRNRFISNTGRYEMKPRILLLPNEISMVCTKRKTDGKRAPGGAEI